MILQGIVLGSLQPDDPCVPFGTDVLASGRLFFLLLPRFIFH